MIKLKKALIFDSGAIITLALNDLLHILEPLKWAFGGEFLVPEAVKREIIDVPLRIRRFALEALMIKALFNKKVFTVISSPELKKETERLLDIANSTYKAEDEWMSVIHEGEASCLALFNIIDAQKKAVVIDERTTRMLCEAPENLRKLFESKLHTKISAVKENFSAFANVNIIRSSELCWLAYKKRIINLPALPNEAISALLFALKYKGCALSSREIAIAKRI
jgi:predicted nucleic acid-binding protein